ncbi:MAG TPA: hypothetical protein VLS90_11950, partial [Thermodesulfobacteriota bacterium]|nr:hypothetical protein [Thermodesulfobacteriota bacterium]
MEKLLIVHTGGIGDLLLALPAMRIFRRSFPAASLDLLGYPERLSLVSFDLDAGGIHSIDQAGMAPFYLDGGALPRRLSDFFSTFASALLFIKKGSHTLASNLRRSGIGRVIAIPPFPPAGMTIHAADYLVDLLEKEG